MSKPGSNKTPQQTQYIFHRAKYFKLELFLKIGDNIAQYYVLEPCLHLFQILSKWY